MTYAELYEALAKLLPDESWSIDVEAWHWGPAASRVEWKIWLSKEAKMAVGDSAEEALEKAREILASRPDVEAADPVPATVRAIGPVASPAATTPAPPPATVLDEDGELMGANSYASEEDRRSDPGSDPDEGPVF